MTKMVLLITTQVEKSLEVAEAWQEQGGAPAVTLVGSYGLRSLKEHSKDLELPLIVSMASVMSQIQETNRMLFSVVEDDKVDGLIEIAGDILGDLSEAGTGVAFVLNVEHVVGFYNSQPQD